MPITVAVKPLRRLVQDGAHSCGRYCFRYLIAGEQPCCPVAFQRFIDEEMMMESAIPENLKCPRTRMRRIDDDYVPSHPSFVARAKPGVRQVVMAYFGVQWRGDAMLDKATAAMRTIAAVFAAPDGPQHHDLAHCVDGGDYQNLIAIAYWTDPESFARWRAAPEVDAWWNSEDRLREGLGYFREIVSPRMEGLETLFTAQDRLEGVGAAMGSSSADSIQEHGYWGSMRDRIPLSQTDPVTASGALAAETAFLGKRVRVRGHENAVLIRSGQDWTDASGREREVYAKEMEPALRAGMDYLRDQGVPVGCYSNRYLQRRGADGKPIEKSFGLSYWRSLADMEKWSQLHHSHCSMFASYMRLVKEFNSRLQLRFYHEVSVLRADEQEFEYINCHANTGLINGLPMQALQGTPCDVR